MFRSTVLVLALSSALQFTAAFAPSRPHNTRQSTTAVKSLLDDINAAAKDNNNEFSGFNPFDYKTNSGGGRSAAMYSDGASNIVSLRKTAMSGMLDELLATDASEEQMLPILEAYKPFLLEPLDDDNAVLEPDSIYRPGMKREERYQAYRTSMEQRVSKARNGNVQKVLTAMMNYVLSFE